MNAKTWVFGGPPHVLHFAFFCFMFRDVFVKWYNINRELFTNRMFNPENGKVRFLFPLRRGKQTTVFGFSHVRLHIRIDNTRWDEAANDYRCFSEGHLRANQLMRVLQPVEA